MEDKLIDVVRGYVYLYDKKCKLYRNKLATENAWQDISKIIELPPEECIKLWTKLRNNYSKAIKENKNLPSGSGRGNKKKEFAYIEKMGFLRPYIQKRKTVGNIQPCESPKMVEDNLEEENSKEETDYQYDGGFSSNLNILNNTNEMCETVNLGSDEELFEHVLGNKPEETNVNYNKPSDEQPGSSHHSIPSKQRPNLKQKFDKKPNLEEKLSDAIDIIKERNTERALYPEVEHFTNLCSSVLQRQKWKKRRLNTILKLTSVLYEEEESD